MKKIYFGFLLILLVVLGGVSLIFIDGFKTYVSTLGVHIDDLTNTPQRPDKPLSGKYRYVLDNGIRVQEGNFDIDVFESPSSDFFTPSRLGIDNFNQVVVNGGYFMENKKYIGLLWDGEKEISAVSIANPQSTHIARFDKTSKKLTFIDSKDFTDAMYVQDANNIYFQTGPLIIKDNEVQTSLIDRSLNGNQSSLRSFIGVTSAGKIFVGITSQGYDLRALAKELLGKNFYEGQTISVVNLDGGSSTALYSAENPEMSFRDFKQLPYLIEFK